MEEIISEVTRIAFRESIAQIELSRIISSYFAEAGIPISANPPKRLILGEGRRLVEKYYSSVDWRSPLDIKKVIIVYEKHLLRLVRQKKHDVFESLIKSLERDLLTYRKGKITFDIPEVHETDIVVNSSEKVVTASDLGEYRRFLFRIMDLAEGNEGFKAYDEGPSKRLTRLKNDGLIPNNIASLMHVMINYRNEVEYNKSFNITEDEVVVIENALLTIKKWAAQMGW
jgi:hypothetical protein